MIISSHRRESFTLIVADPSSRLSRYRPADLSWADDLGDHL